MASSSSKDLSSTNKIYCEDCKAQIPKGLWAKHQTCQRHLRARAAGLFYQRKRYQKRKGKTLADEARKRMKEDPDALLNDPRFQVPNETLGFEPAELRKSDLVTTKGRVKGVWVLLQDTDTGASYYKNRLSGRIQRHKPVGLREEDIEVELIATAGEEREPQRCEEQGEESKPGEWQEVNASHLFGGADQVEAEDPAVKPFFEAESEQSSVEEEQQSELEEVQQSESGESQSAAEEPALEKTHRLRAAEEDEEPIETIVAKAIFQEVPQTVAATFPKRTKKAAVQL